MPKIYLLLTLMVIPSLQGMQSVEEIKTLEGIKAAEVPERQEEMCLEIESNLYYAGKGSSPSGLLKKYQAKFGTEDAHLFTKQYEEGKNIIQLALNCNRYAFYADLLKCDQARLLHKDAEGRNFLYDIIEYFNDSRSTVSKLFTRVANRMNRDNNKQKRKILFGNVDNNGDTPMTFALKKGTTYHCRHIQAGLTRAGMRDEMLAAIQNRKASIFQDLISKIPDMSSDRLKDRIDLHAEYRLVYSPQDYSDMFVSCLQSTDDPEEDLKAKLILTKCPALCSYVRQDNGQNIFHALAVADAALPVFDHVINILGDQEEVTKMLAQEDVQGHTPYDYANGQGTICFVG